MMLQRRRGLSCRMYARNNNKLANEINYNDEFAFDINCVTL